MHTNASWQHLWVVAGFLAALAGPSSAEQRQRIVVAGGDSFVPGMFINTDGEPDGTDVDLWKLWSKKTGVDVEIRLMDWPKTIPLLLAGEVDAVDGMSYTVDRAKILDFTEPYSVMEVLVFFHKSIEGIRGIKDLAGFPIGVLGDSNTLDFLLRQGADVRPMPYVNPEEMIREAVDGHIRVFVCEEVVVHYMLAKMGGGDSFRRAEIPLFSSDFRMAVRKGDTDTLELIQRGMSLITPKERTRIRETWTGVGIGGSIPWRGLGIAVGAVALALLLLLAWNAALRRRVAIATKTLRASEERNRLLIENSPVPILVHSEERIVFVNPLGVKTLAAKAESDIVGKMIWEIVHPDSQVTVKDRIRRIYEERQAVSPAREKLVRLDGRAIDVEVVATPTKHEGKPASQVVFTDITERLEADENLRRERETVARVSETSPVGISMVNAEGQIVFANAALEKVLGLSKDSIGQRSYNAPSWRITAYDGGPFPDDELPFSILKRTGEPVTGIRHAIEWPDGRRALLSVNAAPLRGPDGELVGMVATVEDVTERERSQDALLQSERNYREIFNATNEAIFIHDAATGAILDSNARAEQMYGFTREEAAGLTIGDISVGVSPYSQTEAAEFVRRAASEGPQVFEWRAKHESGEPFWVEVALKGTEIGGVGRVLAVVRDISARKDAEKKRAELETKMQQTQKLESLGVLTGGIAHDFNNLLTVILGNAGLVLEDLPRESSCRRMLQEIEKTSIQASELCQQMLAYAGRGQLTMTHVDLTNVLREMEPILAASVSKKATLKYELRDELLAIEGDISQLRQVIMNLVINASEAQSEETGEILVRTTARLCERDYLRAMEPIEELPEGEYVCVEVRDSGCGMGESTRRKIFDPFYSTKFTGRGLGLAAVQGIVRGHRGAIDVESELAKGSVFRVFFPSVSTLDDAARIESPPERVQKFSGTVLLVDDEEAVREVVEERLKRFGFDVIAVADGEQALSTYRTRADDITLVLLDLKMPNMDGEECFLRLKEIRKDVRVILSSGYDQQSIAPKFKPLGLAGFIKKPYTQPVLAEVLARVLGA